MNYVEYRNMAYEHKMHIFKMRVFVESAIALFEDFPEKLNGELKEQWKNRIGNIGDFYESFANGKIESVQGIKFDDFAANTLILSSINAQKDKGPILSFSDIFNFDEIIYYQALVMNYSRIDAFFNDSIKCICEIKPGILINQIDDTIGKNESINDKNITWKAILNLGSYENVMEYIINDFIYKLGLKSLKERVAFINDKLKIKISKEKINLDLIYEGEQFRHSIVHKGGIVDRKLASTLNKEELKEGSKIKIEREYLWDIFKESEKLISIIVYEFKEKYFKEN